MKLNVFLALLLLVVMGCGCSKKSSFTEEATCGCEMPNTDKEIKRPNVETVIRYNEKDDNPNNPYGDTFVIVTSVDGMFVYGYVCNEDILPQEVKKLKNTDKTLKIKYYEGYSKELCKGIIAPTHYMYKHIELTKIELL